MLNLSILICGHQQPRSVFRTAVRAGTASLPHYQECVPSCVQPEPRVCPPPLPSQQGGPQAAARQGQGPGRAEEEAGGEEEGPPLKHSAAAPLAPVCMGADCGRMPQQHAFLYGVDSILLSPLLAYHPAAACAVCRLQLVEAPPPHPSARRYRARLVGKMRWSGAHSRHSSLLLAAASGW